MKMKDEWDLVSKLSEAMTAILRGKDGYSQSMVKGILLSKKWGKKHYKQEGNSCMYLLKILCS
jgi:hypothetical protein